MGEHDAGVTAVVMARRPLAGAVKTRLTENGWCNEEQAAAIALAMMRCTVRRLECVFGRQNVVLALTADGESGLAGLEHVRSIGQGGGDLGARLVGVWERIGAENGVAFFGVDAPDGPLEELQAIGTFLSTKTAESSIRIGPAADGGFWSLCGARLVPDVFANIDWGTNAVYDQVCANVKSAGLSVLPGRPWFDVDYGRDVEALMKRLAVSGSSDKALSDLHHVLASIIGSARAID